MLVTHVSRKYVNAVRDSGSIRIGNQMEQLIFP